MFDARHRLVLSYNGRCPSGNHPQTWYQQILGNWQANGITTIMSGTPFTVYDSTGRFAEGGSAPEISGFSSNRPDLVGNPNSGPHTPQEWFNVAAFQRLNPTSTGRAVRK